MIDFKEKKAKINNEITVKSLITNLLTAINNDEIEDVIYVSKDKEGFFNLGCNDMRFIEAIGMLEVGKQHIINDMSIE